MRDLYALLLVAMTLDEAKTVLGLPPGGSPSHEEITRAYRQKAIENHPDRGGQHEKMVEVNVAKDILEGKQRPTYERGPSPAPEPRDYGGYGGGTRYEKPKDNTVSFDEAKGVAGIPSDVDWQFVTERQRGRGNYSGDESSASKAAFVAYGVTDSKHVFVAAMNNYYESFYVGGRGKTDVWTIKTVEIPIKAGQKIEPSWLAGNVIKALKLVGFEGKFNFKVVPVKGKGWKLDDKIPTGSSMSIKHVMVDLGMVSGDDPSVAARKQVIEITAVRPDYRSDDYKIILTINGKRVELSDDESKRFCRLRLGRVSMLNVIYGEYVYGDQKKVLTRLRRGKLILEWLAENAKSLPPDALAALGAAAKQMK